MGKLPGIDKFFFEQRLAESKGIVEQVAKLSEKPLVIQFSGGKDSMAMVGLVREVTDKFVCGFMETGFEFPEAIAFAKESAKKLGVKLIISTPDDHLGGFFERLPKFGWPTIHSLWCNRDLKIRPEAKVLSRIFGKGEFYKLVGVRRLESTRRRKIYNSGFFQKDYQIGRDTLVYPILNWSDDDVLQYLESAGLPTSGLYKKYGVSGCYWCPFYQVRIYEKILRDQPNLYDEFIDWENRLGKPSVIGHIYLRDIKERIQGVKGG